MSVSYTQQTKNRLDAFVKSTKDPDFSLRNEKEIEAEFLASFVIDTVKKMNNDVVAGELSSDMLEAIRLISETVRGVFPYWADNDILYKRGRRDMAILSVTGSDIETLQSLKTFLGELPDEDENEGKISKPITYGDRVSVIMPTYNRGDRIRNAIESVMAQTYENLELLISDDGSKDNTEEVVMSIMDDMASESHIDGKGKCIRYIKNEINKGTSGAKNAAIAVSDSPILAFCDDDDLCRPQKIEKQVKALADASLNTGFSYCEVEYHRADGKTLYHIPRRDIPMVRKNGFIYPELLRRNFVDGPSMVIRRDVLGEIGFFDERLTIFEDWDMALRLSKHYDAVFVDETLYDYYETAESLTSKKEGSYNEKTARALHTFFEKHANGMKAYGFNPEESEGIPT